MEDKDESLAAHLEALRGMLIRCFSALGIGLLPLFFVAPYFMRLLIKVMVGESGVALNYFSPMEVFILQIKVAFVPALYENERRFVRSVVLSSSLLFIFGVLFCIFFILPLIISFGVSFASADIQAVFGISNVITLALWLSVIFGLMFQFPLITYALIRSEITTCEAVREKRPYIFVGILIVAAILTPPDVVSQLMLAVPTYLLFEAGLFAARRKKKD